MKDNIENTLKAILDKHEANEEAAKQAENKRLNEENEFLAAFLQKRGGVVQPAMEEIGRWIEERGHRYQIATQEDGHRGNGNALIRFSLVVPHEDLPYLAVICDKSGQCIRFHESTVVEDSGHAGSVGEVSLEELTSDRVQEAVVKMLAQVLG